jgi:opacity protein-like surface antigen
LKKLVALFVVLAAFLSFNNNTFSQPQFIVHLKGGYDLPMPDLKGDVNDSADQRNTLGINTGFGFGADAKYYLGKKRNVGIVLDLMYNMFSTKEDTVNGLGKDYENKLNAFTVGLGVEYSFMPKGKTKPFLGVDFTGHFFSGDAKVTVAGVTTERTMKSASRFGLAFGGGLDFSFSKSVGAVVGIKYHLANLIGKEELDTSAVSTTEYQLVDKEYTVGTVTIPSKNISYIQFYAGVSFFLNSPKKKVSK